MRAALRLLSLFFALALVVVGCRADSQVEPPGATAPAARAQAPAFTLKDQSGASYSLATYSGQKLLLVFYMGYF